MLADAALPNLRFAEPNAAPGPLRYNPSPEAGVPGASRAETVPSNLIRLVPV